jgi:uncharacterized protein YoxC
VVELLLAVATLVVAAAVLYVTVTLGQRTRRTTGPLIDDVSGQLEAVAGELRHQLQGIVAEMRQDRDQLQLDGRKTQGRLDHADSRLTTVASQLLSELDTLKRLTEQLGARQDQLGEDLRRLPGPRPGD